MTDEEYRRERKKIVVPLFFRRKVFIVLMLVITSGIMTVAATYAWFILSTAPEVTGVTATVGANGSLEIALLNNETGVDLGKITAAVGDSVSVAGIVRSNQTWGNVVDLSDTSYGLGTIILNPSVIHTTDADGRTLDTTAMLSVPKNGTDGRIKSVEANTIAAVYNDGAFVADNAGFGVKAIGSYGSIGSNRSGILNSSKNAFTASSSSANSAAQGAIKSNGKVLVNVAMNGRTGSYSVEQLTAVQNMAKDMRTCMANVLTAYKHSIIATAAANAGISNGDLDMIRSGVMSAQGNAMSSYASNFPSSVSAADINKVGNAIASAEVAIELTNNLLYTNYGTENEEPVPTDTTYTFAQISSVLEKLIDVNALSADNVDTDDFVLTVSSDSVGGVITDAADYIGSYTVSIGLMTLNVNTSKNNGAGVLKQIDLSGLTAPEMPTSQTTANSTITNFYGYVIDLAFRTNVDTDLKLQGPAIDRVYTDGAGGTMGKGSTVLFTKSTENMNDTQIRSLLSAVRVVFFDPDNGEIYASAKLGTASISDQTASAELQLDNGDVLTGLRAAEPKKLSVLFYFDGTDLSNVSVINAKTSGTMTLNLQFASSVELVPMEDSDLKSATTADRYIGE